MPMQVLIYKLNDSFIAHIFSLPKIFGSRTVRFEKKNDNLLKYSQLTQYVYQAYYVIPLVAKSVETVFFSSNSNQIKTFVIFGCNSENLETETLCSHH